jgi:hypothetical protein
MSGPRRTRECAIFFDIGEGCLFTEESLQRFRDCLSAKAIPPRAPQRGTGRRGRDKMLRPDGLLALHYHLLREIVKRSRVPRATQLRAGGAKAARFHVACAWGLRPDQDEVVRRAQRLYKPAASELMSCLTDDEARGLLVCVNAMAVEFAEATRRNTER